MSARAPLHRSFDLVRLAFVPCAIGLLLALTPLQTAEYWWDVSLGLLLAGFHAIPTHDPFSFVSASAEIFVQPWIGLYWLYSLHELAGLAATLMLRNLAVALSFGLLAIASYARNGHNGTATMAWCTALGVVFSLTVAELGVEVFVWPLFAGALALGLAIRHQRLPAWTALTFVVLSAFWVNLAPRFIMAAAVPAALALVSARESRRVAIWLGASAAIALLAAIAHPAGFAVLAEMESPGRIDVGLVLLAATVVDIRVFPVRQPVGASRLMVFGLATLLLGAMLAAQPWSEWHGRALHTLRGDGVRSSPPYVGWMPSDIPVDAVEVLRAWGTRPRVFVDYAHAGYVAYELGRTGAQHSVFLSPWTGEEGRNLFEQVVDNPAAAAGIFQQLGVQAALLDPARHDEVVTSLRATSKWKVALETSDSVLFVQRTTTAPSEAASK